LTIITSCNAVHDATHSRLADLQRNGNLPPIVSPDYGLSSKVAVVQAQDRYMDCPAILIEVQANNKRLQELASEEGWKTAQNVGAGVAGLFIWPLWFGMDFQGTAGKEAAAIQSRQQYLAVLAEQRRCGEPEQPKADATPKGKKKVTTTTSAPPAQADAR